MYFIYEIYMHAWIYVHNEENDETHAAIFPGASVILSPARGVTPRGNTKTIGQLDFSIIVNHTAGRPAHVIIYRADRKKCRHIAARRV